jgi:hypothetical protein
MPGEPEDETGEAPRFPGGDEPLKLPSVPYLDILKTLWEYFVEFVRWMERGLESMI